MVRGVMAVLLVGCCVAGAGCGGDDDLGATTLQVGGTYALQLVNGDNGCQFNSWQPGESTGNVPLTITQTDTALVGQVDKSGASLVLGLLLGTATFKGQVDGNTLHLEALGDRRKQKTCEVQWRVSLDGESSSGGFSGTLTFRPEIDLPDNPDCAPLPGCSSTQTVAAVRTSP